MYLVAEVSAQVQGDSVQAVGRRTGESAGSYIRAGFARAREEPSLRRALDDTEAPGYQSRAKEVLGVEAVCENFTHA